MSKGRLEAFSDGVLAIIITIMILEIRAPHEATFEALRSVWPALATYLLSFAFIGIYWVNHHHLLQPVRRVTGGILWANMHLLFWLSLVPFATAWMGEYPFAKAPVAVYGGILWCSAVAFQILVLRLVASEGRESLLGRLARADRKGITSQVAYTTAVGIAFVEPRIAVAIYVAVAAAWIVPDRAVERELAD